MTQQPDAPILPHVEENEASSEVAHLFDESRRVTQTPYVLNFMKFAAPWLPAAELNLEILKTMYQKATLPGPLVSIIGFVIATDADCEYCVIGNEIGCRVAGIDDATLDALIQDLDSVSPERLRAVVAFARKTAKSPQLLEVADYDALREHGISDEEIVEIVTMSAIAVFNDIMADGLKMAVDGPRYEALDALRGA
jgi:alkylhydroperoxidase family enzyme